MRTFAERTQHDCDKITRRAARAYTDKEISQEQMNDIIRHVSEVEEVLREVEDDG
jgi:Asp-tRNA(Asn)/Glu-tRNA(Gln) amidotransferase C subunit